MENMYPPPKLLFALKGNMQVVHCVLVLDEMLLVGTQEGNIHIWNLKTYREEHDFNVSDSPILALHEATNNNIVIQDKEGSVYVWQKESFLDPKTYKEVSSYQNVDPKPSFCKFIVFDRITGNRPNTIKKYNKWGQLIKVSVNVNPIETTLPDVPREETGMKENVSEKMREVGVNCSYLLTPYESNDVCIYSLKTKKKVGTFNLHSQCEGMPEVSQSSQSIMCMKYFFLDNNDFTFFCTEAEELILFNLTENCRVQSTHFQSVLTKYKRKARTEEEVNDIEEEMPDMPMAIDFETTTMRGIIGTNSRHAYCIQLCSMPIDNNKSKLFLKPLKIFTLKHSGVSCIKIKDDNFDLCAISFWNGSGIYLYKWRSLKCLCRISYDYNTIHDLYFFGNNKLAAAGDNRKVALFQLTALADETACG